MDSRRRTIDLFVFPLVYLHAPCENCYPRSFDAFACRPHWMLAIFFRAISFFSFLRRVTTPMRSRFNVVFINGRKWKDVYREMLTSWRIFARFVQISIKIGLLKTSPRLRPVVYRTEFVSSPFLSSPVFYAYGAKWPN